MPYGDAARIHRHIHHIVRKAREANERVIVIRAGDVCDALRFSHSNAVLDVCQVLETQKLRREAGLVFLDEPPRQQNVEARYRFRVLLSKRG